MLRQCIALMCLSISVSAWGAGTPNTTIHTGWQSVGPAPGAIEAAVLVDVTARVIYIGSVGGGVLKSTDGGATFTAMNNGLRALTVSAMAMAPDNPDVVYASTLTDVYKTVDGGANWTPTGAIGGVVTLAMDPTDPNILYTGSSPNGGLTKTVDGGATWSSASTGIGTPAVFSVTIDPRNPSVLYAGTLGLGAFKSVDAGVSWAPLNIDTSVWTILVDPADSNVIYAGTNGKGVYQSIDGGTSFAPIGSPTVGVVFALAKSRGRLYAGTASQGVSVSADGGRSWRNAGVSAGLGLILSVDQRGAVYLGTNFDGAFVRPPGEGDWRRLGWAQLRNCACQNGHALAIDPADHKHVFLSTNDGGLLVTNDGGRNWQDGGTHGFVARAPRSIAFDPLEPRRVYAGSFTAGGFFKSEDHGRHWQQRVFGSNALYTTGVAVDPFDQSVYVATLSGDGAWKSVDFGETFTRIDRAAGAAAGVFLGLTGRGIAVDPHNQGVVYIAASRGKTAGVWRSVDGGGSWVRVDTTPTLSVTVDPVDSTRVYAGTSAGTVLKSIDGGLSFSLKSLGLPLDGIQTARTGNVQVNPRNPNIVYAGFEGNGVFKSTDGAESWAPINTDLGDLNVFGLALDLDAPNTIYVSTSSSVYKSTTGGR
jgi:photosystem II stability/assembly factor-like uncharacterized protein